MLRIEASATSTASNCLAQNLTSGEFGGSGFQDLAEVQRLAEIDRGPEKDLFSYRRIEVRALD